VMERLLDEISFNAPDMAGQTQTIDTAQVDARLGELSRNEDLSRFIL
jgi:ATP-dependent HslUV protease ATP-binding subunit HslU